MDLYSRLYKYRERPSASSVENFSTEAFSDLFNRLTFELQTKFLIAMLPAQCKSSFLKRVFERKQLYALTQVSINIEQLTKRPDIVIYIDGDPIILFEAKIFAAIQEHRIKRVNPEAELSSVDNIIVQSQLQTYLDWIKSKCDVMWPGAVVFLTHRTKAPEGFQHRGESTEGAIGTIRTWKDVGDWITDNLEVGCATVTYCALGAEFRSFLERMGLMTEFVTSRDLAATALFLPSYAALEHTLRSIIDAVVTAYPKSKAGGVTVDFWCKGKSFCGWYYLNNKFNPPQSRFALTVGVCFPDNGSLEVEEPTGLPSHEAFMFAAIADEWGKNKTSALFQALPQGWIEINEQRSAVAAKPLSGFLADPDLRAHEMMEWAKAQVGQAMASIANFETAPVEHLPHATDS